MCYYHCTRYDGIEDTNLAEIGSDADKSCKQAAADLETNWEGAGERVGIEIWCVDTTTSKRMNSKHGSNKTKFAITRWPKSNYGHFYKRDCYIILETTKIADTLLWNIFFWIGENSTGNQFALAAYKANELCALLGGMALQHREVDGNESEELMSGCFPEGITYVEGTSERGFVDEKQIEEQTFMQKLFSFCSPCW